MPAPAASAEVDGLRITLNSIYDSRVSRTQWSDIHDAVHATWLIRSGQAEVLHAGGRLTAGPGTWVLLPAWLRRDMRFTPDTRLLSVRCTVWHEQRGPLLPGSLPTTLPQADAAVLEAAALTLLEASRHGGDLLGAIRLRAALLGWLAGWLGVCEHLGCRLPQDADGDPRIAAARAVLDAHGRIRPVPYPQLATATGWSRPQIDRRFAAALGCSPARWLDRRAVERTDVLLAGGEVVKSIAHRLGFTDDAHIARWYRRMTGRSPRAARGAQSATP
jgi:AraC-like DNA-binding protein